METSTEALLTNSTEKHSAAQYSTAHKPAQHTAILTPSPRQRAISPRAGVYARDAVSSIADPYVVPMLLQPDKRRASAYEAHFWRRALILTAY